MSSFSAEWLALREPHDAAARSEELVALLRGAGARPTLRAVVDLGSGSGANMRWLAPRLGGDQAWRLVDHDDALLAAAERATREWAAGRGARLGGDGDELVVSGADFACRVSRTRLDLAAELDRLELAVRALVTSSALLDLVSAEWLEVLARRCRDAAADVCFALTYDGRTACTPAEPEDAEVLELFNRHQRGDKGFGPALGPSAARRAAATFTAFGYRVVTRASDWRIGPRDQAMQRALLGGWLDAAVEIAPWRRAALAAWQRRRLAHVASGHSELVVGHADLVGSL